MDGIPMTLSTFKKFVAARSISEFYEWSGTDYEGAHSSCAVASEAPNVLSQLKWKQRPTVEILRRLFNQVNTFYAERWALADVNATADEVLQTCARLILYRQGKSPDWRTRPISFGVRSELDVRDPRRQFQLLYGTGPRFISRAMNAWSRRVASIAKSNDNALFLTMALLAIHPFVDGNGRLARLAYTWLLRRFRLPERWLAEADDGEFLRVGHNIESTEYLMGAFIQQLCSGFNIVPLSHHSARSDDDERAIQALERSLHNSDELTSTASFVRLAAHLEEKHHLRPTSPRFAALERDIAL